MEADHEKIENAVLALVYITLHKGGRAWKQFDWEVMNRLHEKGLIENPINKAKSVVLTEQGLIDAERLFKELFSKN
jgi:hypothetical protein